MAIIKSGNSTDQLTIDATSKAARVTMYNSSGSELSSLPVSVSNFPATQNVAVTSTVETEIKNDSGNPVPVSGTVGVSGSVAVTGTFFQATQPISAASLPLPSGAATSALQTQPGIDIGDVTINNASGASAVNVQDGGNSLTIDGSVSVSNFPATQNVAVTSTVSTEIMNDTGNPIPVESDSTRDTLVGEYTSTTFRIAGLASNPHNLFSIWNPAASGRNIAVRRITLQCDHTTLLAANLNIVCSHPTAQPTAGTLLTGSKFISTQSTSIAEARGASSADGVASAITATAGTRIWSQFGQRPHTLAGWFTTDDLFLIPEHCYNRPIILAPGDGLLVNTVSNATTGANYIVNCWWTEYT